jgi:hypothetical protein
VKSERIPEMDEAGDFQALLPWHDTYSRAPGVECDCKTSQISGLKREWCLQPVREAYIPVAEEAESEGADSTFFHLQTCRKRTIQQFGQLVA